MIRNNLEQVMLDFAASRGRRLSINEICEATGLAHSTITRMLKGQTTGISYDTLDKICNFFGCTPNDILFYTPLVEQKEVR